MDTPAERAEKLSSELQKLSHRLRQAEQDGARMFTREDIDRIISRRMAREKKTIRELQAERDELQDENERLRREVGALS